MAIKYSNFSPYYTTPIGSYLDVLSLRDIPENKGDVLFEVTSKYEYRPDLLANDLYKDSRLWWVFAVRNKTVIKDPIFDLVAGVEIYVPTPTDLSSLLGV